MRSLILSICLFFSLQSLAAEESPSQQALNELNLGILTFDFETIGLVLGKIAELDKSIINMQDADGQTPLTRAIRQCPPGHDKSLQIVRLLLQNGASTQIADDSGWTPHDLAVGVYNMELVNLLREHNNTNAPAPAQENVGAPVGAAAQAIIHRRAAQYMKYLGYAP